jgi:hypothetical protein
MGVANTADRRSAELPIGARARRIVADRDARLVVHQVADVLHVLAIDVLGGDD